jgi:NAD(P)H-dependent FMN reductase|uniref:NADPH-dependent FMN reductase n=1 Tax=Cephaloticoccus sp. TaxID=1985742 RepID=UPI00404B842F
MRFVIISSSLDANSRSVKLAEECRTYLADQGHEAKVISLKEHALPPFDNDTVFQSKAYQFLHRETRAADSLIFATPIYNWSCCAELKKYIEAVGSTPGDGSLHGAFYDKVLTFVCAAGGSGSYMAYGSVAMSMMLDFKCVINPYQLYVHNRHWDDPVMMTKKQERLEKTMKVAIELTQGLSNRTYTSTWEI